MVLTVVEGVDENGEPSMKMLTGMSAPEPEYRGDSPTRIL